MHSQEPGMSVALISTAQRRVLLVMLVLAAVVAAWDGVRAVPVLIGSAMSVTTGLGWVYLVGRVILIALWASWAVKLLRGGLATVVVSGSGHVRITYPWRVDEVEGVGPEAITVRTFWRWHWVSLRGTRRSRGSREVPGASPATFSRGPAGERRERRGLAAPARRRCTALNVGGLA